MIKYLEEEREDNVKELSKKIIRLSRWEQTRLVSTIDYLIEDTNPNLL